MLTYSQQFEFLGNVLYDLASNRGRLISTEARTEGVCFNTRELLKANILGLAGVKRIITLENAANFHAQEYRDDTLYVLTHGFLSPAEVRLCLQINAIAERQGATIEHCGDLDFGGIRIFMFLRDNVFPSLRPLHMDRETYQYCRDHCAGYQLSESVKGKLTELEAGELAPLIQLLLEYGIGYEQECIIEQS